MGNYNPHRPTILGQEWVGIREEPYALDHEVERGYSFVLDSSATVVSGSFFLDELPTSVLNSKTPMMSVYRRGEEHLTGPMRRVVIPAVSGIPAGNGDIFITGNGTVAEALRNPNDQSYISFSGDVSLGETAEVMVLFDVNAYSAQLSGKRIVSVNILSAVAAGSPDGENKIFELEVISGSSDVDYPTPLITSIAPQLITNLSKTRFGNTNIFTGPVTAFADPKKYPLRYQDLQRYQTGVATAAERLGVNWFVLGYSATLPGDVVYVTYTAMEVIYCEETRLLYGGRWAANSVSLALQAPTLGHNVVQLRPADTFAVTGKVLTPGEYTVTVTLGDTGDFQNVGGGSYAVKALRQTYALPSHDGVEVVTTTREGQAFTQRELDVIPQLSLHTASAVVTGVHAYGELAHAHVYQGVDATPDVIMRSGGAAVAYPQVRFYARRFGETNVPLRLSSLATPTWAVSLSADELDALPEVVDGWREVTLRFADSVVPTFSDTGAPHTWEWTADGLDAGAQWQVLVPRGASFDTGAFDTDPATYGGSLALTLVTNESLAASADATLIFSQDPPAVTGLACEVLEQSLEPVGEECQLVPGCTPTGLYYHHLTWDARDVLDLFDDRTETTGWHEAPSGQEWTHTNGTPDDYLVADGSGDMVIDSVNTVYFSLIEAGAFNVEVRTRLRLDFVPSGNSVTARVVGRVEDVNNYYEAQLVVTTAGVATLRLTKRVGGTASDISATVTLDGTHAAGDAWNIALRCEADHVLGMAWKEGYPDPLAWQVVGNVLPGDALTGTQAGVAFRAEAGFSGGTVTAHWEEFSATDSDLSGFELQRQDDLDDADEWNTIVRSTGTAVREFNDYEARVGVESRYRIRTLNALDFEGPWSEGTTSALDLPGGSGNFATSPDDASLDVTGDLDLRARIAPDDWTPSADQAIVSKSNTTGNQRSYQFILRSTGALRLTWSTDGTGAGATNVDSTAATGLADGVSSWVRVTLAVATGTVTFYTSENGLIWTEIGDAQSSGATSIFASTATANVGARSAGTADVFTGLIYLAEIRDGIDGTVVADPRFDRQSAGDTSFEDSTGKVWTVSGTAAIVRFPDAGAATSTLPTPGVAGVGTEGNSITIFTTNERQDGSSSLAYVMVWDGDVSEDFAFPEAGTVQFRDLYRRDFPLAFRPLERGGERFTRDLLVQNAVVPSGLLRDGFRSLRDLAWEDVSYVCVRNELGDRWFAAVLVPSGRVRRDRRLYVARIEIVETSDVPSVVDPAEAS